MATKREAWISTLILYTTLHFARSSENLSLGKIATQSSTLGNYEAGIAVDGCDEQNFGKGCCSHTEGRREVWWRVDLGQRSTIQNITIFYRDESPHRLAGYLLYVSNTTGSPTQGVLCYEDKSSTVEQVQLMVTHQCPYVARYVTIYNYRNTTRRYNWYSNRAFLELCEVQVFGCAVRKYGTSNCDQDCSINCYGGNCNPTSGNCLYCLPGLSGSQCVSCSSTCAPNKCNTQSGICYECIPGTYGKLCEHSCSTNCVNNTCSKDTGHCFECVPGKYNTTCDDDCPINCGDINCTKEAGSCYDCKTGYYGDRCDLECPPYCKDSVCDKDTGHCYDCIPGTFSERCDHNCSANCFIECDKDTGNCSACVAGQYGGNCSLLCGQCDVCTRDLGVCETDCHSGFEGPTCELAIAQSNADPFGHGQSAGVAVGAFVMIVTIAIVLFVVIRRRRLDVTSRKRSLENIGREEVAENHIYGNSAFEILKISDEDPEEPPENSCNVYVNTVQVAEEAITSDAVYYNAGDIGTAVSDLKSMVIFKMQNKAKAFKDEYESLPSGTLHKHAIGSLPENKLKKRFKTTFPYDHSRVILDKLVEDPHSDYINANYIDSMTQVAEYVATQGPKPGTIDDFWRMIWQLKSDKIVMLTNLIEGAKPKCAKYWPDEDDPLLTAHFNIVLDRERVYAFYVIRDLTLTDKKTKSPRQVHQFHYTTWPDHGTPDPNELVVFHRRVKLYENSLSGKMVVHCSAGIGRTGTFIALDALLEYGNESGRVDVSGYIRTMRKDRVNMVQTGEQYIAVHHILLEAFDMPDSLIPRMGYHTALTSLCTGEPANQTKLRKEYQLTQNLKPAYTQEDFKGALLIENKDKNKTLSALAVDKFRVYLRSHAPDRTDYINAVTVPSYTSKTGYIVTHTPLEDTVVDMLTLIKDHGCTTVVIIENDSIDWIPAADEFKTFGEFTLQQDRKTTNIVNVALLEVTLEHRTDNIVLKFCVFHLSGWDKETSVVPEPSCLLGLLELVDGRRKSANLIPTLVMCRDGYSQSGLFCCISNARDQMKSDEEVDIFQISRQLLVRRPEFITNFDQYRCCYTMIKEYLDTIDVYMN